MPMPASEVQALNAHTTAEMLRLEPPFFGVSIFDVDADQLDEFTSRMQKVAAHYAPLKGFAPHFCANADYGSRLRLVRVNQYTEAVDAVQLRRLVESPDV